MSSSRNVYDPFDRSNGNGSRKVEDDWTDSNSIYQNEWGSHAATTFNPDGTDAYGNPLPKRKRENFDRLYELHNGKGDSSRKDSIRQSHIVNDAKTFMSVLEMPENQRSRVLNILQELDISSKNFKRRYEKIILCICSLVADAALTERLRNESNPSIDNRLFLTDEFRDLMDATKMSTSEHRRIRNQIRQESDQF